MKYGISPLYQVMEQIECYILTKGLKSHDKFPGERKLCEEFNCNRVTLRNAFECLENAGKTYSIRGMGNYVAEEKIEIRLTRYDSFYQRLVKLGQNPSLEILSVKKKKVSQKIAKHLKLMPDKNVWEIKSILQLNDIPVVLETNWICAEDYLKLNSNILEQKEIYEVYKTQYNNELVYGSEMIGITSAQDEEAEYLEVSDNAPLFFVQKVGSTKDTPVIYSQAVVRPDKIQFVSVLK